MNVALRSVDCDDGNGDISTAYDTSICCAHFVKNNQAQTVLRVVVNALLRSNDGWARPNAKSSGAVSRLYRSQNAVVGRAFVIDLFQIPSTPNRVIELSAPIGFVQIQTENADIHSDGTMVVVGHLLSLERNIDSSQMFVARIPAVDTGTSTVVVNRLVYSEGDYSCLKAVACVRTSIPVVASTSVGSTSATATGSNSDGSVRAVVVGTAQRGKTRASRYGVLTVLE